jgi:tetratricopeptide (TPR) repeat protein
MRKKLLFLMIALGLPCSGVSLAQPLPSPTPDDLFVEVEEPQPLHLETGPKSAEPATSATKGKQEVSVETEGKGPVQLFRLGNEAYEKEQFEEAIAYYEAAVERGVRNGDLFFNLGNAFFRTGDFGRAVLFYEKARNVRPRDLDVEHNLSYAHTFLIDKEISQDQLPGSMETLLILHRETTLNETLWILAALSAALAVLLYLKVFRLPLTEKFLFGYLRGALVVLLLLQVASAGTKVWVRGHYREGVILNDATKASASPTSEEQLFELNSGTKVEILAIRNGFAHIRLPSGIPAFISQDRIGEV